MDEREFRCSLTQKSPTPASTRADESAAEFVSRSGARWLGRARAVRLPSKAAYTVVSALWSSRKMCSARCAASARLLQLSAMNLNTSTE